jgi:hypothetical protein
VNIAAAQAIGTETSNDWYLKSNASARWVIQAAGHFLAFTDNTYDIGASGANRPRDFFLARNAAIGGTFGVTGIATFGTINATTANIALVAAGASGITSTGPVSFSSTLGVTGLTTLGTLTVSGLAQAGALRGAQLYGNGSACSIAKVAGSGTFISLACTGTSSSGNITFTCTSSGSIVLEVTYPGAYVTTPSPVISSCNNTTASLQPYATNATASTFQIIFTTAPSIGHALSINFAVIG